MWRILQGDVMEQLAAVERASIRLVFADPPYNIGVDYGDGAAADRLPDDQYAAWLKGVVAACSDVLTDDGSLWLLIDHKHAAEAQQAVRGAGLHLRRVVAWTERFGVYQTDNFASCWRPLFYAVKDRRKYVFNADAVLVPSDRQTKYGDKRANPAGKIMTDVWTDIPRLAGTHKERIAGFPTQLPVALPSRVIAVGSEPGDVILDPFSGSGTTGVAALRLGRRYVGIDHSAEYVRLSTLRLQEEGAKFAVPAAA